MPPGYYRHPTISQDAIVFVCEDDLWTVPVDGGIARRLTSNLGEVSYPLLSPDGTQLAFIGREEGHAEVYLMPAAGGPARRLTYLGASDTQTAAWAADGSILFSSNAGHWYLRFLQLYRVGADGSAPERLPYGLANDISFGPGGAIVLGRTSAEPARWKRYRGGTKGQIWIDPGGAGEFRSLIELPGNLAHPLWIGSRIYFIADHEGIGNLYSCLPDGSDLQRHTDHEDFYARNPSTDGKRIVYHAGADLYLYDPVEGKSRIVPIQFHSPQTQRNRRFIDPGRYLEDWALHPKGHAMAVTARGKLFSFSNWEGPVIQHAKNDEPLSPDNVKTAVRFRLPRWLKDGKRLVAVTDAGGEEAFIIFHKDGSDQGERLEGLDIGRPEAVAVNPQKDQILFSNHRYELSCLDLETRELRFIERGKANPIQGFDWSPDGRWAVFSASISLQRTALKLWDAESGEVTLLTEPVLRDIAPAFDPSGGFIYFLAYRDFDPVYDSVQFDLGFPRAMKPYLITLRKDLMSPFIPQPPLDEEDEESEEEPEGEDTPKDTEQGGDKEPEATSSEKAEEKESAEGESEEEEPEPVVIDLEGIQERILAFPLPVGRYGRIAGVQGGKVVYTRYPVEGSLEEDDEEDHRGSGTLFSYSFADQKEDVLTQGVDSFKVTSNGAWLSYLSHKHLRVVKAGEKPGDEGSSPTRRTGWINLYRCKVSIIPGAEWRQMFREAWRLQRDQFWTEDMSQVDWLAVHDRYLPLVDRISSRSEFSDLMWETQGELGTSHAYEFGGDYRPEPVYHQGFLGAEFEFDSTANGWRIARIYSGDPGSSTAQSPLRQPGVNIQPGDVLLAINGQRLSAQVTPARVLVNQAAEEVQLTILVPEETQPRSVTVKTLVREEPVLYRAWVEANRRRVHSATEDRVGYLHIPDMGPSGYAEFHRGYLAEVDREGLIIDLRFNRGGHVSALLLEKLSRQRIGYDKSRWSEIPEPYPPESVLGPMVALTNEYAGSDGDIFSHGFKLMKLGPLIGKRTWGGVIGIWPRFSLVDGTQTTQPEFSFWFEDVGWGVENYGTDPDVEIDNTPQDYVKGYDAQLERAIAEILHLFAQNPPSLPDFSQRPNLALPKLPRR